MEQISNLVSLSLSTYLQRLTLDLVSVNPLDPVSQYGGRAVCLLCSMLQVNALFFMTEPKNEDNWVLINGLMIICLVLISIGSFSL